MSAPAAASETAVRARSATLTRRCLDVEMAILPVLGHAAMPVAGVFAQAHVGDDDQVRVSGLQRAGGLLHDAVVGVGTAAEFVLVRGDAEEQDRAHPGVAGQRGPRRRLRKR